jgi:hypothetical protein
MERHYRQVPYPQGGVQYQVITKVGHHWRHIAVVSVKDGKASKADRFFYSTREPEVILPFEVMGRDFIVTVCREMREIERVRALAVETLEAAHG